MKKEILEGNKLIALFMGAKVGNPVGKREVLVNVPTPFYPRQQLWTYATEDLMYHKSWDWLMSVYLKAKKEIKSKNIRSRIVHTGRLAVVRAGELIILEGDILGANQKLVEAIKWYNENKNK